MNFLFSLNERLFAYYSGLLYVCVCAFDNDFVQVSSFCTGSWNMTAKVYRLAGLMIILDQHRPYLINHFLLF